PPYWFGKKARRPPFLLPREARARLTVPADVPPGPVHWQVASVNGASPRGILWIQPGPALVEQPDRTAPQELPPLPVIVHGQIRHIAEVDRYRFQAETDGLIRCRLLAPALRSALRAALQVHGAGGELLAEGVDTAGNDLVLVFSAVAGQEYTLSLYDVDFRGNRAFNYQLEIARGPAVLAAVPAAGKAGETRDVTLIGYGVATGAPQIEQTVRPVTFPAETTRPHTFTLDTAFGTSGIISLPVSDLPQQVEQGPWSQNGGLLPVPCEVSGTLSERYGVDRLRVQATKGQAWSIRARSARFDSPLDLSVAIADAEGKELARNDDLSRETTDAGLEWTAPADGIFEIQVTDASTASGSPASAWRLEVREALPDFELTLPEQIHVPAGGKFELAVKVLRKQQFTGPVQLKLTGLPAGVTVPEPLLVPEKLAAFKIPFETAANVTAVASMVRLTAEAVDGERKIVHEYGPICLALTIAPPFSIDAEGKDDVTKWPRGTTFPAPVLIEREEGFNGEILLEMASKQGRHRQGISGPVLPVPPGTSRILYPVFLPEWLETTRTSRMKLNGVAQVKDPAGNIRYSLATLKTRIGFLPTGAVFKLEAANPVQAVPENGIVQIPVVLNRARELTEAAELTLLPSMRLGEQVSAEPVTMPATASQSEITLRVTGRDQLSGEIPVTIRATVLRNGVYPAEAETTVILDFGPAPSATAATAASR
ncbi:MAG: hypothetical protein KDA79_21105, partial [Planctomycetaceae bacterium]|nr:hypothetical protein [Planctomycetaceae bacterium]